MFGYGSPNSYPNPATSTQSCPDGYVPKTTFGTTTLDYAVVYCYHPHTDGIDSLYDFGGMYGFGQISSTVVHYNNPATGDVSCPSGYVPSQLLGTNGLDWNLFFCYRMHVVGQASRYNFGGMYGFGSAAAYPAPAYPNLATGAATCPAGYSASQVLGTANVDWPLYFCYR
jgi:hypothetical protein